MINYSREVQEMCCVAKGPNHGPAPIPEEGKWVKAYEIKDISGFTHGVGCAHLSRVPASSRSISKRASSKKLSLRPSAARA